MKTSERIIQPSRDHWNGGAVLLSGLMHVAFGALVISGVLSPNRAMPEPEPLVVELIFEPEPPLEVVEQPLELPEPEPLELAEAPEPEVEPEAPEIEVEAEPETPEIVAEAEPEPAPEPPAEPELEAEVEPEPVEEPPVEPELVAEAEPEPVEEPLADPRSEPEAPSAVTELPPPPLKSLLTESDPQLEPIEIPAAAIPELAAATAPEDEPAPPSLDRIAAPVPDLLVPPLPQRRPQLAEQEAPPPTEEAVAEEEPVEEELVIEPETVAEAPPPAETLEAPAPYIDQSQIGEVAPDQLLANLQALQNEDLQAELNPELWDVVRRVRAQIAQCWQSDPQDPWDAAFSVDIQVAFEPSGALKTARIREAAQMVNDDHFKDFAVQARNALKICSPFDLPGDKYEFWRSFTMRFLPRNNT